MKPVAQKKGSLVLRLASAIVPIMLLLAAFAAVSQFANAKHASESAIRSYGMKLAESYVGQMPIASYERFLAQPEENETYWTLRDELDQYRETIGAMYVYFVIIDGEERPIIQIDGQPKDSELASPIGEVTDIPAEAVADLKDGRTASSPLIDNPEYGQYISSYAPIRNDAGKLIGVLGIDTEATAVKDISNAVVKESLPVFIAIIGLTVLAVAAVLWFVARTLRPLKLIVTGAEGVASGKLAEADALLRSNAIRSNDEIGAAYRAMADMSGKLNVLFRDIVSHANRTSEQLVGTSRSFAEQSGSLLDMNRTITDAMTQMNEGANAQQSSTVETSKAMEDISSGVERVSRSSRHVAETSIAALEEASSGLSTLAAIRAQIRRIAAVSEETNDSVRTLASHSDAIGGALLSIREIADRTKLLALNASIEAARAGEHGSGFAVVAAEVRKLAESSAESVRQIESLLSGIQNESAMIAERMNGSNKEIREGVELSENAEASVRGMVDRIQLVAEETQELSAASEQMSASTEEAAAAAHSIADIASLASKRTDEIKNLAASQLEAVRQMSQSSLRMSGMSQDLQEILLKLKV
jgi:methyl-accepting chemotaxis protein